MIFLALALMALAQATPAAATPECENPETQTAMNICAGREFERADADLNAAWKAARAFAKSADAGYDYDDGQPGYWDRLLAAQRAWIAYRDAHCQLSSYDARGGSMQPLLRSNCMTTLTRQRTRELRDLLSNQVSGEAKAPSEE